MNISKLATEMRAAIDAALPEDEPNFVPRWVFEECARVAKRACRRAASGQEGHTNG